MPDRSHLRRASEQLERAAADATGETADRLQDLSGQLDRLADRDRGPDHGRLARIQTAFNDVESDLSGDALNAFEAAREAVTEYRRGVEGV